MFMGDFYHICEKVTPGQVNGPRTHRPWEAGCCRELVEPGLWLGRPVGCGPVHTGEVGLACS